MAKPILTYMPDLGQSGLPAEPTPITYTPLHPDVTDQTPGNQALENADVLSIGALLTSTILTGYPHPSSYDPADLIAAGRWLWLWHVACSSAKSRRDFIELLSFLLKE